MMKINRTAPHTFGPDFIKRGLLVAAFMIGLAQSCGAAAAATIHVTPAAMRTLRESVAAQFGALIDEHNRLAAEVAALRARPAAAVPAALQEQLATYQATLARLQTAVAAPRSGGAGAPVAEVLRQQTAAAEASLAQLQARTAALTTSIAQHEATRCTQAAEVDGLKVAHNAQKAAAADVQTALGTARDAVVTLQAGVAVARTGRDAARVAQTARHAQERQLAQAACNALRLPADFPLRVELQNAQGALTPEQIAQVAEAFAADRAAITAAIEEGRGCCARARRITQKEIREVSDGCCARRRDACCERVMSVMCNNPGITLSIGMGAWFVFKLYIDMNRFAPIAPHVPLGVLDAAVTGAPSAPTAFTPQQPVAAIRNEAAAFAERSEIASFAGAGYMPETCLYNSSTLEKWPTCEPQPVSRLSSFVDGIKSWCCRSRGVRGVEKPAATVSPAATIAPVASVEALPSAATPVASVVPSADSTTVIDASAPNPLEGIDLATVTIEVPTPTPNPCWSFTARLQVAGNTPRDSNPDTDVTFKDGCCINDGELCTFPAGSIYQVDGRGALSFTPGVVYHYNTAGDYGVCAVAPDETSHIGKCGGFEATSGACAARAHERARSVEQGQAIAAGPEAQRAFAEKYDEDVDVTCTRREGLGEWTKEGFPTSTRYKRQINGTLVMVDEASFHSLKMGDRVICQLKSTGEHTWEKNDQKMRVTALTPVTLEPLNH